MNSLKLSTRNVIILIICNAPIELLDAFVYSELTIKRRRETSSVTLQQPAHLGKVLTLDRWGLFLCHPIDVDGGVLLVEKRRHMDYVNQRVKVSRSSFMKGELSCE
jgi:hypothetical protein